MSKNSFTIISRRNLLGVFLRSFFIEACWNLERMQNLGFFFAIYKPLMKIYQGTALKKAMLLHLEFFNTHPYLGLPIMGSTIAMEEERRLIPAGPKPEEISQVKSRFSGPLAAAGDTFIWSIWKSLCFVLGAGVILLSKDAPNVWLGVLVPLTAFNIMHLWIMWRGLELGYQRKTSFVWLLQRLHYGRNAMHLSIIGLIMVIAIAVSLTLASPYPVAFGWTFCIALFLSMRGLSVLTIMYVLLILIVLSFTFGR